MVTKEEKQIIEQILEYCETGKTSMTDEITVSYTHLRAHETN